jgi:hypothetical protein
MVERGHVHILDCGNGRRRKRLGSVRRGGERYAKAKSVEAKPVHFAIAGVPNVQGVIEPLSHVLFSSVLAILPPLAMVQCRGQQLHYPQKPVGHKSINCMWSTLPDDLSSVKYTDAPIAPSSWSLLGIGGRVKMQAITMKFSSVWCVVIICRSVAGWCYVWTSLHRNTAW